MEWIKENKVLVGVLTVIIGGFIALVFANQEPPNPAATPSGDPQIVRENTHQLDSAPNDKVTFVEFLDFECEACGAAFPTIERLREEYEGKINFYIRYFPIASHANARNAAYAVESAFEQGKGEEMYKLMYQNQKMWGEQRTSQADVFRNYAVSLGLDMEKFDEAVTSQRVKDRVSYDVKEGANLGVQATPTFFFNGEKIEGGKDYETLKAKIEAALKE